MKRIFGYLVPYLPKMTLQMVIKFFGTVMDLLLPSILSYVIDSVVPQKSVRNILFWGAVMILCSAAALIFSIIANRMASRVARDAAERIRHDLFDKITHLSSRQADRITVPSLEARLTADTYNVHRMIGMIQRMGVRAPILLIGGIAITLTMEPVLTLMLISMLPVLVLTVWLVSRKGMPLYLKTHKAADRMIGTVRENATGVRVIKALSMSEHEKEHFDADNRRVTQCETRAASVMAVTNPLMNFLLNTGLSLVLLAGAFRVNSGLTQPGVILAFMTYFTIILNAMLSITRIFVMISRGSASAARINEVMELPDEAEPDTAAESRPADAHILFDDVTFSYLGREPNVQHISFALGHGETLGIIGATGSGKSTLVNLLMRFYDPQQGAIYIDGRPVSSIPFEELRTKFGVVFQNDTAFAETIAENIDFGRGLSAERIAEAAADAQADFIGELDGGFEHMLTARGTNLSGGQRQRVLVARALAAKPEILVLDDSSSALDYKTDARLRTAIRENYGGVTTVLIAQRISSIRHADKILVLDGGRCIGCGTHEELMESCAVYRETAEMQMGEANG